MRKVGAVGRGFVSRSNRRCLRQSAIWRTFSDIGTTQWNRPQNRPLIIHRICPGAVTGRRQSPCQQYAAWKKLTVPGFQSHLALQTTSPRTDEQGVWREHSRARNALAGKYEGPTPSPEVVGPNPSNFERQFTPPPQDCNSIEVPCNPLMELQKADFKDHPMECPHCGTKLIIGSPMDQIIAAHRTCPVCKKES